MRHIQSYIIEVKSLVHDNVSIIALCIYDRDDISVTIGRAVAQIDRKNAAKVLSENRRAGMRIYRQVCTWTGCPDRNKGLYPHR